MLIPKDLEALDLTLKQVIEIIEIRRAKQRLVNRLELLPDKGAALKRKIVNLQEKEGAMLKAAKGESYEA